MSESIRTIFIASPGRTGTQSLSYLLDELLDTGFHVRHEHPLSRLIMPVGNLSRQCSSGLTNQLLDWETARLPASVHSLVLVDPLLSYGDPVRLQSRVDAWILITRDPIRWVESLARKIRFQKLYPLIRPTHWLRPPYDPVVLKTLQNHHPQESRYPLQLLAAYVGLHRRFQALTPPIKTITYEDLFNPLTDSAFSLAWAELLEAIDARLTPQILDKIRDRVAHQHQNAAPVSVPFQLHDPIGLRDSVNALIDET